jgi:hypothetical protein
MTPRVRSATTSQRALRPVGTATGTLELVICCFLLPMLKSSTIDGYSS